MLGSEIGPMSAVGITGSHAPPSGMRTQLLEGLIFSSCGAGSQMASGPRDWMANWPRGIGWPQMGEISVGLPYEEPSLGVEEGWQSGGKPISGRNDPRSVSTVRRWEVRRLANRSICV